MAKWREREHILNRFPSSVRDIFMCRATGYHWCVRVSTYLPAAATTTSRRDWVARGLCVSFLSFFLLPRVAEFKRFKTISLGMADRCWSTEPLSFASIRLVSVFLGLEISVVGIPSNGCQVTELSWCSFFFSMEVIITFMWMFHRIRDNFSSLD